MLRTFIVDKVRFFSGAGDGRIIRRAGPALVRVAGVVNPRVRVASRILGAAVNAVQRRQNNS